MIIVFGEFQFDNSIFFSRRDFKYGRYTSMPMAFLSLSELLESSEFLEWILGNTTGEMSLILPIPAQGICKKNKVHVMDRFHLRNDLPILVSNLRIPTA